MSRQARRSGGLPKASLQPPEPVCSRTDTEARAQGRSDFGRGDDAGEHPVPLPRLHTQLPLTGVTASELPHTHQAHPSRFAIDPIFTFSSNPNPDRPKAAVPGKLSPHRTKPQKRQPGPVPSTPVQTPGTWPVSTPQQPPTHRGPSTPRSNSPAPSRSQPPTAPHPPGDYPPGDQPPTSTSSKCHP